MKKIEHDGNFLSFKHKITKNTAQQYKFLTLLNHPPRIVKENKTQLRVPIAT